MQRLLSGLLAAKHLARLAAGEDFVDEGGDIRDRGASSNTSDNGGGGEVTEIGVHTFNVDLSVIAREGTATM